eukprot:TRINITY_DN17744_c0_g1_i1.p2 TRINITY_DN17744_c0_g1~~TRINITY_DN17744_c0_g1_i1.p2  ORF type:complete len:117 (-),score=4.28 TRINITY_DN17744_c0_g1_i1:131-481(-)
MFPLMIYATVGLGVKSWRKLISQVLIVVNQDSVVLSDNELGLSTGLDVHVSFLGHQSVPTTDIQTSRGNPRRSQRPAREFIYDSSAGIDAGRIQISRSLQIFFELRPRDSRGGCMW